MCVSSKLLLDCQVTEAQSDGLDGPPTEDIDRGWTSIGRIIARKICYTEGAPSTTAQKSSGKLKYLVKWLGLPYDEASWETEEDLKGLSKADFEQELARFVARGPIVSHQAIKLTEVSFRNTGCYHQCPIIT